MISFESDYTTGAHPKILERLAETNMEPLPGYGSDKYCESAKEKIKEAIGDPEAMVFFLTGGTQTNSVIISSMLNDYEGVIAAETGHISAHEAGAVEYTGHKVITLPGREGKLEPKVLKRYLEDFYADANHEHMPIPGMVYISHPTEYGTLYSKGELEEISDICRSANIPLFMDGARLGYGLMSYDTDVDIFDIDRLCDVFYIGGTKVGALCGEAVVFTKHNMPKYFLTSVKKRGALIAKGRLLGIQFDTLFTDGLYFEISKNAIDMAEKLKKILTKAGLPFFIESPTNQQFVIIENEAMKKLSQQVAFSFWEKYDDLHTVVRFATGWSTTEEDLKTLEEALEQAL
ncbi:MAG: low specificity L-threonine aldolase [Lachnospiraceae bacterium]|nr:low specificity L-threonine aldolase [Lachnospiraceae bacterium]